MKPSSIDAPEACSSARSGRRYATTATATTVHAVEGRFLERRFLERRGESTLDVASLLTSRGL
jgi:hypothetical protein